MAVLRPRNRIVYFRLSQEEFHQLDALCKTADVGRSVSELSREAVRQLILNGHNLETGHVGETLERVDRNVSALNDKLQRILQCLGIQQDSAGPDAVTTVDAAKTGQAATGGQDEQN